MGVIFIERTHLSIYRSAAAKEWREFYKISSCMKGLLWCLRALSKKGSCERKWLPALIICCRSSGGQAGCSEPKPPHSYTTMLGRACLLACALLLLTAGAASGGALLLALLSSLRLTLATLCKAATRWWLPTCNLGGVQVPQTRTRSSGRQGRSQGAVGYRAGGTLLLPPPPLLCPTVAGAAVACSLSPCLKGPLCAMPHESSTPPWRYAGSAEGQHKKDNG